MKNTSVEGVNPEPKPTRGSSDTLCKMLAEEYPEHFAQWLFDVKGKVTVEKTELSREPIRADSVIFSDDESETLHAEFQTTTKSKIPMPLRVLDYYVGFKRQDPDRRVRQVVVVLKPTGEEIPDRYQDVLTLHRYGVVKLWELDPAPLLDQEGLLPLATLCRAESASDLLAQVATRINQIEDAKRRRETLNWSRVMAGLRYDREVITRILKESDMLEESVIYQDIFSKGQQRGLQEGIKEGKQEGIREGKQEGIREGKQEGIKEGLRQGVQQGAEQEARKVALRLIGRRFGKLADTAQRQIELLAVDRLEALCDALLDFQSKDDLTLWLKNHTAR